MMQGAQSTPTGFADQHRARGARTDDRCFRRVRTLTTQAAAAVRFSENQPASRARDDRLFRSLRQEVAEQSVDRGIVYEGRMASTHLSTLARASGLKS
jgi:hypothetical protein